MADKVIARLLPEALDPAEWQALMLGSLGGQAGAITSFIGRVRGSDRAGKALNGLFLEHHPTATLQSLERLAQDTFDRFALDAVHVAHRCGLVLPGEPIVWVAAAAAHRRAALEGVDYLMDRLKTEAVLWKREDGAAGSIWIEPTADDYRDRTRWEND